jgi:excisionase family DNA binding protein
MLKRIHMSKMLTIPEAAEHFKVSTATVRRWIRSGRVRSQMTLGPFGEQWMVEPDGLVQDDRSAAGYIAVEQLVDRSQASPTPDKPPDHALLREAEQALQEAWQAKERVEKELEQLRQAPPAQPDVLALRCDLEGSERQRAWLQRQLSELQQSEQQAWQDTRTALQALSQAYQDIEELSKRTRALERESECFRRTLAQRLGLDWREHDTLQLFLRWESSEDFPSASLERSNWSNFRRQAVTEDLQQSAG